MEIVIFVFIIKNTKLTLLNVIFVNILFISKIQKAEFVLGKPDPKRNLTIVEH